VTYSLLTRTNEVTAMMVNGVSLYRVVTPVLAAGLGLSALSFGFYGSWAARAALKKDELSAAVEGRTFRPRLSAITWAEASDGHGFYHFDGYEPDHGVFHRLSYLELDADGTTLVRHVYATRAAWEGASLRLEHGWEREFRHAREVTYRPFDQQVLPFAESRRDFGREWGEIRHLTSEELDDYIRFRERHGLQARDLEIEQASRRAMPASPLVMMLLAMPFAFAIGKRGSLYGIGVAIVLAIVYWSALVFATYLGKLGVLPPTLAAWSPNLFFAIVGLAAFLNLRT
jgi:lipopolysaccharide export LptBFGC system permease protein LptF